MSGRGAGDGADRSFAWSLDGKRGRLLESKVAYISESAARGVVGVPQT